MWRRFRCCECSSSGRFPKAVGNVRVHFACLELQRDLPRLLRGSGARHQTVPSHHPRKAARQGPVGIKRCGEPCQTVQRNAAVSQPSLEQFGTKPHRVKARLLPSDPLMQQRSEEHTSELQSLMRTSYAVFCMKDKKITRLQYKPERRSKRTC